MKFKEIEERYKDKEKDKEKDNNIYYHQKESFRHRPGTYDKKERKHGKIERRHFLISFGVVEKSNGGR